MKKDYQAPVAEDLGTVPALTAAMGTSPRVDFSEFSGLPASTGSFDVCDSNPNNNPGGDFCENTPD